MVKQMLYQAKMSSLKEFVNNTVGVVGYLSILENLTLLFY